VVIIVTDVKLDSIIILLVVCRVDALSPVPSRVSLISVIPPLDSVPARLMLKDVHVTPALPITLIYKAVMKMAAALVTAH
jgi:hypothetical protein